MIREGKYTREVLGQREDAFSASGHLQSQPASKNLDKPGEFNNVSL